MVYRVFVEKRDSYKVKAQQLLQELKDILGVSCLEDVRIINRYDVDDVSRELFDSAIPTIFSEPQLDKVFFSLDLCEDEQCIAVESLPGQFDQRADSASQCLQFLSQGELPSVRCATLYVLKGHLSPAHIDAIKSFVINPVEMQEASMELPSTLHQHYEEPSCVGKVEGFCDFDDTQKEECIESYGLAMDLDDLDFCQTYFRDDEQRDPTITELKVIDTYWSDHCRHTTFNTQIESVDIEDAATCNAYDHYLDLREKLGRTAKPITLMDMATMAGRWLKAEGKLPHLDESEEINACTVKIKARIEGEDQDWLLLFKNETHNHPTEIEPFGGAATCVGGAIRDLLSGRSYVYQAMRITGSGDPRQAVQDTIHGKLPQRKISLEAAEGYSSYGNQIGLATGQVHEIYHQGYIAKHMEIGAVVGATPADHVRREVPAPGDVVVLLGGRTGRDGIGGATGSSKAHKTESLASCGAEVQKGNAPVERKIQRLFKKKEVCRLIKRCNDFGAGGVSVAIGELADGLKINLDAVPKKYEGLDGTELALSESQERMAVVLERADLETFLEFSREENLEATLVAEVDEKPYMTMTWKGQQVVHLSRAFLSSNGAAKHQDVKVITPGAVADPFIAFKSKPLKEAFASLLSDINIASNKGLVEQFDSTIGAASVLMPLGGKSQLTPAQAMVAKLPVKGETSTVSAMSWGFNPYISEKNQYVGAYLAVVESIARLIASGISRKNAYLTLQEYFEKLHKDKTKWGKPFASILGAFVAQLDMEVAAIGGKDSMSGSFEDLHVPPTLVSFAVGTGEVDNVLSPEFKDADHAVVILSPHYDKDSSMPRRESMIALFDYVEDLISSKKALSVSSIGYGGAAEALFKMSVGNSVGLDFADDFDTDLLFGYRYGSFILELEQGVNLDVPDMVQHSLVGLTTQSYTYRINDEIIDLEALQKQWEEPLHDIFPYRKNGEDVVPFSYEKKENESALNSSQQIGHKHVSLMNEKPRVLIPVFPGNNCEYDSARAIDRAGGAVDIFVIKNLTAQQIKESVDELSARINKAHIIFLPGGFSGGDEPDGSAKFITSFFRAPKVTEAVRGLLNERDGLMLGICNGFQALIKLGLVPYGDICETDEGCATLTHNTIGRHQSSIVHTRIASNMSPWLSPFNAGDIHSIAISHGEGRFVAPKDLIDTLARQGQIATQYASYDGVPSMDLSINPNGSFMAIEGITSPDGRVFGKMGHSERCGEGLYKNIPHVKNQPIFENGIAYFK